jgi:predicted  nucleic acid-binding Zn-ribbon protein
MFSIALSKLKAQKTALENEIAETKTLIEKEKSKKSNLSTKLKKKLFEKYKTQPKVVKLLTFVDPANLRLSESEVKLAIENGTK